MQGSAVLRLGTAVYGHDVPPHVTDGVQRSRARPVPVRQVRRTARKQKLSEQTLAGADAPHARFDGESRLVETEHVFAKAWAEQIPETFVDLSIAEPVERGARILEKPYHVVRRQGGGAVPVGRVRIRI